MLFGVVCAWRRATATTVPLDSAPPSGPGSSPIDPRLYFEQRGGERSSNLNRAGGASGSADPSSKRYRSRIATSEATAAQIASVHLGSGVPWREADSQEQVVWSPRSTRVSSSATRLCPVRFSRPRGLRVHVQACTDRNRPTRERNDADDLPELVQRTTRWHQRGTNHTPSSPRGKETVAAAEMAGVTCLTSASNALVGGRRRRQLASAGPEPRRRHRIPTQGLDSRQTARHEVPMRAVRSSLSGFLLASAWAGRAESPIDSAWRWQVTVVVTARVATERSSRPDRRRRCRDRQRQGAWSWGYIQRSSLIAKNGGADAGAS